MAENLDTRLLKKLGIKKRSNKIAKESQSQWDTFISTTKNIKKSINIAAVGKYFQRVQPF